MSRDIDLLRGLARLLDEDRPPPPELYVPSPTAVVTKIVREITIDPTAFKKHLIFGARGGGKSTQLQAVRRQLGDFTCLELDLDAMGIAVGGITAFDLLYVIGVAGVKQLGSESDRERLFGALDRAYRGADDSSTPVRVRDAIDGIAGFSEAIAGAALAVGVASGAVVAVAAGVAAVGAGLRLRSKSSGVVQQSSEQGQALQQAFRAIVRTLRETRPPIVVLIDGLEKVNGQAAQWFRDTFENTRLLIDAEATLVVASPPCSFSHTNAANQYGYVTHVLYGHGTTDVAPLTALLARRLAASDVTLGRDVLDGACTRFARDSGGHPRYAVSLLKRAVQQAINDDRGQVTPADLDAAVRELRQFLTLGLTEPHYRVLNRVDRIAELPDNEIGAELFANGRILADPPDETGAPTFRVHPLIELALARYRKKVAAADGEDGPGE